MRLLQRIYNWFECPPRLLAVRRALERPPSLVLDVGCANRSPTITKRQFPDCQYHGVDYTEQTQRDQDRAHTDTFFRVDLEQPDGLSAIEDDRYDAVICSHVLEHLTNPYSLVPTLAAKTRVGGVLYIEVPSARSAKLPRAATGWFGIKGCLNFQDDPGHRTMIDLAAVKALLIEQGFQAGPIRRRRLLRRVLLLPAYLLAGLVLRGYVPARVVWDVTGFADTLLATRPPMPAKSNGQ